jgi:hypothetical protein
MRKRAPPFASFACVLAVTGAAAASAAAGCGGNGGAADAGAGDDGGAKNPFPDGSSGPDGAADTNADASRCTVPNNAGIVADGDALWNGASLVPNAYDFDGDGCVDGVLSVSAAGAMQRVALDGKVLWSTMPANAAGVNDGIAWVGDWSGDGVPDVIAVAYAPTGQTCGTTPTRTATLLFFDGKTGALETPVSPMTDMCWTFGTTTYPTIQLYTGSVVVGDFAPSWKGSEVYVFPYYATTAWMLNRAAKGQWVMLETETDPSFRHLMYPSTSSFDSDYDATNATPCMPSPWNEPSCFVTNAHCANMVALAGGNLFVLTSGRAVSYRPNLAATGDLTWAAGNRTDHAGRNYGLVTHFESPDGGEWTTLHGGCASASMVDAIANGAIDSTHGDYYCGIHRHYEVFSIAGGATSPAGHTSLFYSYADVDGQYNRLQYPRHAVFEHAPSKTLWTAFSLYDGTRWHVELGDPRMPGAFAAALDDAFLWDVRDLDGDGAPEWIVTKLASGAGILPPRSTSIVTFDGKKATVVATVDAWIPVLPPQVNRAAVRSSDGGIYAAGVTDADGDGVLEVVVQDAGGKVGRIARGAQGWALVP